MEKISISEAKKQQGGEVALIGFISSLRVHKGLIFADLRDNSGVMQLVIEESLGEAFKLAETLTLETYLKVWGSLKEKPMKKGAEGDKDYELSVTNLGVVTLALPELPIPVSNKADNEAEIDLRFDWRFLDLRSNDRLKIFKTWTELEHGCRTYLLANNFTQIYTPTFMGTASETGADVFAVKYFDKTAYLAQSPQFYKQMAIVAGMSRVFMTGTVYRAEKSNTNRHVTEFTGWDLEVADIENLEELMKIEEEMLVASMSAVTDFTAPSLPFPRISLAEAKEKLAKKGIKSEAPDDFSSEEEKTLGLIAQEEFNHDFLFITDYPNTARPFYHMRDEATGLTKSYDLLYKGLEITTGAIREHRIEILEKQALEKGMNLEELKDYLNFFRYGAPAHGGMGIGPARIIMKMLDLNNIKEAILLPRDVKRLNP